MRISYIITLILLFFSCHRTPKQKAENIIHFDTGFSLYQDTIFVNIKGEMTHALKHHNKFYVLFEQKILKYGGHGKRWLYIFSDGKVEKILDCPENMNAVYCDFFVKNDSIILKQYMHEIHFYFNSQNFTWKEIDNVDDLIFEDEDFFVYSLNFGNYRGKTWFKDKKTGQEYLFEATTPLVNKIGAVYYLTKPFKVLKIENPLLLNKCSDDAKYKNIVSTYKYYSWHGETAGIDIVYEDTTFNYYEYSYKPYIITSFVLGNELLHIYETDTATYIAKHESNSIIPIQKIAENLSFYNLPYSYRYKNLNGKNELLKFRTDSEQKFGIMEIIDNNINITYFINSAILQPKSIGSAKADSIFINRLSLVLKGLGKLKIENVHLEEKKWGTFDITPNHKIGISESYYPNHNNFELDTAKSYLIQEDSLISNSIIYYATKENCLIRVVSINWGRSGRSNLSLEKSLKEALNQKINSIELYIKEKTGKPNMVKEKKNYTGKIWETPDGLTINLENRYNDKMIRLIIYKN